MPARATAGQAPWAEPFGADTLRAEAPGLTFTGHRAPRSRWFLVTHTGVAARVDGGSIYTRKPAYLLVDFGAMRNVTGRLALGGNLYLGADDYRSRFGPKARVRYWLGDNDAVDIAGGVLLDGADDWKGHAIFPGYVAEASVSLEEAIMLTGAVESIRVRGENGVEDQDTSWYVGGKLGGVAGTIVAGAGLLVALLFEATLGQWD